MYQRHKTYPIQQILDIVEYQCVGGNYRNKKYAELDGVKVKITSARYRVFKNSTKCVCCGLEASFFASEKDVLVQTDKYHFNLYGVKDNGEEVLFTKDHIIPKSKGGSNKLSNFQTMCSECNCEKSDSIDDNVQDLIKRYKNTISVIKNDAMETNNRLKEHYINVSMKLNKAYEILKNYADVNDLTAIDILKQLREYKKGKKI